MDCPLNLMDLPIIGESSHKIGECYCYLCSCGNHKCPSNLAYKRGSSKRSYSTIYKKEFSRKSPKTPVQYIRPGEIIPSSQKMLLETTQKSSFQRYSNIYQTEPKLNSHSPVSCKQIYSSSYKSTFIDWKDYQRTNDKQKNKLSVSPLKFSAKSTYDLEFKSLPQSTAFLPKKTKSVNFIGHKEFETGKTTSQLSYVPYEVKPCIKGNSSVSDISHLESVEVGSIYKTSFLPHLKRTKVLTKRQSQLLSHKKDI